jgi:GT2 family glycosyltransferase
MQTNTQIAVCQPKILSYLNKQEFEYAGAAGGFLDKNGFPFCRGRIFESIEKDEGQYNQNAEITWATGACMFVKSKVFHELGGLDEDFFAHMEEIDFCWRAKNAGYQVWYSWESSIYHVGGGTLPKSNPRKTYLNFRNGLYLLHKNLPKEKLLPLIFIRLILDGIAGVKFIANGRFYDVIAIIKAHFSYYQSISALNHKRKKMLSFTSQVLNPYSIVWAYFLKGIKKFQHL